MDIPSLFMIPSAVSSGKVHSVFPNSTDADFDFNRDSSATRVNSQGLIEEVGYFGSELVTNGSFDTDSDWGKGSGWTISGGKANRSGESGNTPITQNVPVVNGRKYTFSYTRKYLSGSSGHTNIFVKLDNVNYSTIGAYISTVVEEHIVTGEFTALFTGNLLWQIYGIGDFTGYIDNVSIKEVIGDRARLNYEIEGGLVNTKPSLLLENQSTNLVTYSEDFSQSVWNNFASITPIANSIISPEGLKNASTLACSGNNVFRYAFTASSSTNYVGSVFVKAKETTNDFGIQTLESGTAYKSVFNIESGVVVTQASNHTASIEDFGNGWFRCSVKFNSGSSTSNIFDFTGSQTTDIKEFYAWGAMLEQQSYPTSYIPTNGSTQTRAAETCNGAGTSSILPSEEGILYTEISTKNDGNNKFLSINTGSSSFRITIYFFTSSNTDITTQVYNSSQQYAQAASGIEISNFNKIAVFFKANQFKTFINGNQIGSTDTSGTVPTGLNQISFDNGSGADNFYGKIRDIRVYNTKEMTDSEVDILLTKITS